MSNTTNTFSNTNSTTSIMSNLSINKSEKSDDGISKIMKSNSIDAGHPIIHTSNNNSNIPPHKQRLHELFSLIDREFDALYEENQELKAKLAALTGSSIHLQPTPLRKQTSNDSIASVNKQQQQQQQQQPSGVSIGAKSLRFVKLQKKLKKENRKYLMLKDFKEHRDGIWEVSACPWDVGYFATASADHTARVCSADGSRAAIVYLAHMGSVNSIRFHPVDRLVCTASGDKTCHIWKLPQAQMRPAVSQDSKIKGDLGGFKARPKPWTPILGDRGDEDPGTPGTSPPISRSFVDLLMYETSARPASAGPTQIPASSSVSLGTSAPSSSSIPISIPNERTERSMVHDVSPNNELVELDETAKIAESAGNIVIRTALLELKGHTGPVVAASWTSSNSVATASWDHSVRVWSADNGRSVATLNSNHDKGHKITNVTTHPTLPVVLFSVTEGSFRIWDYRNSPDKPDVVAAHQGHVSTAIFASDGNSILSGGDDRVIKIWDLRNTKAARTTIRCHSGINRIAISPVTHSIVIPTDGKRSSIYDLQGGRVGKFYHYEKSGHKSMVTSAAWSNDESVIFTSGFDRRVIAWGDSH